MTGIVEKLRLRRDPLTDGERAEAAGKRWVCQSCAAKYDAAQEARNGHRQ